MAVSCNDMQPDPVSLLNWTSKTSIAIDTKIIGLPDSEKDRQTYINYYGRNLYFSRDKLVTIKIVLDKQLENSY